LPGNAFAELMSALSQNFMLVGGGFPQHESSDVEELFVIKLFIEIYL
jgi:hypothetical protein